MAEEKDRLSRELMDSIREQRKLRRQDIVRKVAAGVGGAAETFRTGQSAKSVFDRLRPDYSDQMMDKREKMKRSRSIVDKMEARERYVFGKATDDARNRALIQRENRDRRDVRERDQAQRQDVATRARVQQTIDAQQRAVSNNYKDLQNLEKPSAAAKAYFADMPTYEQRVEEEATQDFNNGTDIQKRMLIQKHGSEKKVIQLLMSDPEIQDRARAKGKEDAKNRIESLAKSNPQDKDLVWAVTEGSSKSGISPAEIHESLDVNTKQQTTEAEQNHAQEIENINLQNEEIDGVFDQEIRKLFQSDTETGEVTEDAPALVGEGRRVLGASEKEAGKIYATKLAELEDVDIKAGQATQDDIARINQQLAMDEALAARQAQQTEAIGEEAEQQQTGFLGFEGIEKPGPGSQAHFRKMLEVIEKFPESPPAQHAKQQIMATAEFKDYQKKHFGDLAVDQNKVYKEMVRDWRKQNREDMAKFRAKRAEKRAMERPLRTRKPDRQTSQVVAGATPPSGPAQTGNVAE